MIDDKEMSEKNEFLGSRPRIVVTDVVNPEDGRTFVWTKMGWFEREEGKLGDIAFTPIADSEDELRNLINKEDPRLDLFEAGGEFRKMVSEEFMDQEPVKPDIEDNYSEDEFEE
jgi:hypothetical protein